MRKILLILSLCFFINWYTFASTNKYDVLTSGNAYIIQYRPYMFGSWTNDCECEIYSDSPDHYRTRSDLGDASYSLTELLAIMAHGWDVSSVKVYITEGKRLGQNIICYHVDFNCTDLADKMNEDLHFAEKKIIEDTKANSWK